MLGVVLSVAVALPALSAPAQRASSASADARPTPGRTECSAPDDQPHDTPRRAPGHAQIEVRDGTICFDIRDSILTEVLSLISALTDIRFTISDALETQRVTFRTTHPAPVEAALRKLLRDMDFFTLYTAQANGGQTLAAVWVYPRGSTRDIAPVPAELWASTGEFERQLADRSSEVRARAIEELIARSGAAALPRVFEALVDDNADVRQRALDAALTAHLEVPLSQLQSLVFNDVSPEVRLRALQALEELPDTTWIIEAATADADPNIRREARNILQRLRTHR
jgi:hypothetical protein